MATHPRPGWLSHLHRRSAHRHHAHDGLQAPLGRRHRRLILGLVLAFFAYHQYYPPLSSPMSHRPYKPRTLRKKERYTAVNAMGADAEGVLRMHHWNGSSMTSEDLRGHTQSHSQSWHATMNNGPALLPTHAPHSAHTSMLQSRSTPVRQAEGAEMDERSEVSSGVPDEERGINKPVPPKSIKEIWREESERGESL